jgi:hypothetical protein
VALQPGTRALLSILHAHPSLRWQIRGVPNATLLFTASFFRPVWREIADLKRTNPAVKSKDTLLDVLGRLPVPGTSYSSLLAFVQDVDHPWQPDGFTVWRALSGILASNADGKVFYQIGAGIEPSKIYAAAELSGVLRDPNVDAVTKDLLAYLQRCVQSRQPGVNLEFLARSA